MLTGAYLNADMGDVEVFMRLARPIVTLLVELDRNTYVPYVSSDGTLVVQLRKALYGCVEAAKLWYEHLSATLIDCGYVPNQLDPCVLNWSLNGKQCTVCLYVDDLLITSRDSVMINRTIDVLKAKYTTLTVHDGKHHNYLGMSLTFRNDSKTVSISMEGYINDLLKARLT